MTNSTNPVLDHQTPVEGSATEATGVQFAEDGTASIPAEVAPQAQKPSGLNHSGGGRSSANSDGYSTGTVGADPSLAAAMSEPTATDREGAAHIYR